MQNAPVMKGSGLKPLNEPKQDEVVHVFGKNLEERVTNTDKETLPITFEPSEKRDDDIESIRKRKFEAITGEEDEETIFQGDFKLFVWDITSSNWIETGRGQLRLNDSIDKNDCRSRLIMRISGTLRIILNVAINKSSFRVIANSKTNLRFTDSQTVWAASGNNADQLKDLIDERQKKLISEVEPQKSKEVHDDDGDDDNKDETLRKKSKAGPEEPEQEDEEEEEKEEEKHEDRHEEDKHEEKRPKEESHEEDKHGEEKEPPQTSQSCNLDNKQTEP